MSEKIKNFSDWLDKASLRLASLTILLILLISIYGAFFRYVLGDPPTWPLSVERILMVWSALLGIPAALKRGEHMGVEGLLRMLPDRLEVMVRYLNFVIISIFVFCLLWYGFQEVANSNDLYMISADVRISSRWIQAAIPVSAFIQLVHLLCAPQIIQNGMDKQSRRIHAQSGDQAIL